MFCIIASLAMMGAPSWIPTVQSSGSKGIVAKSVDAMVGVRCSDSGTAKPLMVPINAATTMALAALCDLLRPNLIIRVVTCTRPSEFVTQL